MALSAQAALTKDRTTAGGVELQHRHFAAIADIIAKLGRDKLAPYSMEDIIEHFADELRGTNGKFDRKRFLAACKHNW